MMKKELDGAIRFSHELGVKRTARSKGTTQKGGSLSIQDVQKSIRNRVLVDPALNEGEHRASQSSAAGDWSQIITSKVQQV